MSLLEKSSENTALNTHAHHAGVTYQPASHSAHFKASTPHTTRIRTPRYADGYILYIVYVLQVGTWPIIMLADSRLTCGLSLAAFLLFLFAHGGGECAVDSRKCDDGGGLLHITATFVLP